MAKDLKKVDKDLGIVQLQIKAIIEGAAETNEKIILLEGYFIKKFELLKTRQKIISERALKKEHFEKGVNIPGKNYVSPKKKDS